MGMYIDENYDTVVSQNRCHSPRHRTTFLTRRPLLPTVIASQPAFFCAFYHASAYSPLLQAIFCITRTTNTTMCFVIVVSKTLQHGVERRKETSPDSFYFFEGLLVPALDNGVLQVSSILCRYGRDVCLEGVEYCEIIDVQVGIRGRLQQTWPSFIIEKTAFRHRERRCLSQ